MNTKFFLLRSVSSVVLLATSLHAAPSDEAVRLTPLVVIATPADHALNVALDPRAPAQPVPAQDGADALRAIPGMHVIRKGGIDGDPLLRGMAGSRLGIVLDDQLLLGGCGHRMDPPTAYVFPALYDRVTLLKGPQSVRHGPGHSAGVVRFERDPRRFDVPALGLRAGLTVGSAGRHDQSVDVVAGSPRAYAQVSANRAEAGDFRDGDGREIHSAYRRWSAQAALGWTPDRTTRLEFSTAFSDGEAAYADRTMDGARFARHTAGLRFERDLTSGPVTRIEANVYRNAIDHVMDNYSLRTFTASMAMPAPSAANPDRETVGGRLQVTVAPGAEWSLDAGLDAQANLHTNRSTMNAIAQPHRTLPRLEDARFGQVGVFAEWTRHIGDRTRLLAGARIDAWQARDRRSSVSTGMMGSAPNPTAGARRNATLPSGFVRYEVERGPVTAFAGIGHAARFPDYWELFSKESATSVSAFETATEETTQIDTGLLYRKGRLQASAALFASQVANFILIESGVRKGLRTATIARSIEATTFGGEATVAVVLSDAWRLDTSIVAVRGENRTDGLPLAQQPPLETRLHLAYASGPWNAGVLVRAVAAQNRHALNQGNIAGQDLGPSDGFVVTSLHLSRAWGERTRLSAGVDNLFDLTYAEHLSRGGATIAGFPPPSVRIHEPGRTLWLKVDLAL